MLKIKVNLNGVWSPNMSLLKYAIFEKMCVFFQFFIMKTTFYSTNQYKVVFTIVKIFLHRTGFSPKCRDRPRQIFLYVVVGISVVLMRGVASVSARVIKLYWHFSETKF